MTRRTKKYNAALRTLSSAKGLPKLIGSNSSHETAYALLESNGWWWDADSGQWKYDPNKSNSIFAAKDGSPTGVVRVRIMAHPRDMERFREIMIEAMDTYGVQIEDVSDSDPNRHGAGERIYMTGKLPPEKDMGE